jgi:gluconate 2-dehydrogenase
VGQSERYARNGRWTGWKLKQFLGIDVHHGMLDILGMGRIGQKVARRAAGFDMQVIYHNTKRLPGDIERVCDAACPLRCLHRACSILPGHPTPGGRRRVG